MSSKADNKWAQLDDRLLQKTRVFDLWVKRLRFPDGSREDDFFYIKTADWVNIIPITPEREVILVKQYRHGISAPSLETPGGMIDSINDAPEDSARRELVEETGYTAREILPLGVLHPNPAMLNNRCFLFLALDVVPDGQQNLEPTEDITLHKVPLLEVPRLIEQGKISHSVVAAAFFFVFSKHPGLMRA